MTNGEMRLALSEAQEASQQVRQLVVVGRLLIGEDQLADAMEVAERASKIAAASPAHLAQAWQLKHLIYFEEANYVAALEAAERVIALNPSSAAGFMQRAAALSKLGRQEEALVDAERAISIAPGNSEVWRCQAYIFRQLNRYAEAQRALDHALALDPRNVKALVDLAEVHASLGHHRAAVAVCTQALHLMREDEARPVGSSKGSAELARALVIQARNYDDLHNYAKALEASNEALQLRPLYSDAWLIKSVALYHLKRLDEVLAASERFVELKPSTSIGWTNLCTILIDLKRYEDALKAFDRVIAISPDDRPVRSQRAALLAQLIAQGVIPKSSPRYEDPDLDDQHVWLIAARKLHTLRDREAALLACDEGIRRCPTKVDIYGTKMLLQFELHRYREITATWQAAWQARRSSAPSRRV
ncbi:MAG TPA: tetratricopeptide repeat protein [Ktedonobacterales bacterium]